MNIRKIRKELGLSQLEFARLLGIHQTAVSQWETGRTLPETDMILRISRLTGYTMDDIMEAERARAGRREDGSPLEIIMPDDSLREARILAGDTVCIRAVGGTIENGAVVAVETEGCVLIRRYYAAGGKALLIGAPEYAPLELTDSMKILGQAYRFTSAL